MWPIIVQNIEVPSPKLSEIGCTVANHETRSGPPELVLGDNSILSSAINHKFAPHQRCSVRKKIKKKVKKSSSRHEAEFLQPCRL